MKTHPTDNNSRGSELGIYKRSPTTSHERRLAPKRWLSSILIGTNRGLSPLAANGIWKPWRGNIVATKQLGEPPAMMASARDRLKPELLSVVRSENVGVG